MQKKFVTIGHITHDLDPYNNLGGGASYTGIAAKRLEMETTVVTKVPLGHSYLDKLGIMGIETINIPSSLNTITTFKALYDLHGNKIHYVLAQQEPITNGEIKNLPTKIWDKSIILIATVLNEVSTSIIPYLSQFGMVCLTPQGYFREIAADGLQLNREPGSDFLENAKNAQIIIFSEEDINFGGNFSDAFWQKLKEACPIVVLTKGVQGAIIAEHGKDDLHIEIFKLISGETKDFSGSGDSFATAFIIAYSKTKDAKLAGTFAALYAAIKIIGLSGIGINSLPTIKQVREFTEKNPERVSEFLEKNKVDPEVFKTLL
jgi:sugar/nucleoside kinase (ribokinase family)